MENEKNASPGKQGGYYGDGGLYKHVKVSARTVEYIILALIVVLLGCVLFGAANGGYTVSFDSRGGTGVEPQKLAYGDLVPEPEPPVMEGHAFLGWFTDAGCAFPWDFASDTVTGSMTLYAGWTE